MNEVQGETVHSPRLYEDVREGGLRSKGGNWGKTLARQPVGGEAALADHIWALYSLNQGCQPKLAA